MHVVEAQEVTFSYDRRTPVLEGVSFKIHEGEFVGIVGPNGAGKSTLLKLLLGLIKPTSGEISIFGTPIDKFKDWKRMGYVPQRLGVDTSFPATVSELLGFSDHDTDIYKTLHLDEIMDRQFTKLSGGQQQRVLLGMALTTSPDLLILDEPTAGLDLHSKNHMIEILENLSLNMRKTILMVSHDVGMVIKHVDRVMCIDRTLQFFGEPEEAVGVIEEMFGLKG